MTLRYLGTTVPKLRQWIPKLHEPAVAWPAGVPTNVD